MPKTVSKDTTEGQYSTEISNVRAFHSALGTVQSTYTSAISEGNSTITSAMSTISGSWAGDDVEVKLESLINDSIKSGLQAIESDISGGSFLSMKNTVNQLASDLEACKTAKHDWEEAKKTFNNTPKTLTRRVANNPNWAPSYQGGQNPNNADYGFHEETYHNDAWDEAKADMEKKERILEQKITTTNTHFSELSQFVFGGASTANNGVGGGSTTGAGGSTSPDGSDAEDSGKQNAHPDATTNSKDTMAAISNMQPGDVAYIVGQDGNTYRVERGTSGFVVYKDNGDGTYTKMKSYDRGPGKDALVNDYYGDGSPAPAAEQPTSQQPAAEQPAAEQPAAEQPAAEQPAAEQPAAEQPAAEQPAAEQPAAEQPAAEQPAAEQPAATGPLTGDAALNALASAQPGDPPISVQSDNGYEYTVQVESENGRTVYFIYNNETGDLDYAVDNAAEVGDLLSVI